MATYYEGRTYGYRDRRRFAAELEAFYAGRFFFVQAQSHASLGQQLLPRGASLLDPHLAKHLPGYYEDLGIGLIRWAPRLVERVINDLTGHFYEYVQLPLVDRTTGVLVPRSDRHARRWWVDQEDPEFRNALEQAHQVSQLQGTAGFFARTVEGEPAAEALHPYAFDVVPHAVRPAWVHLAQRITIPETGNAPVSDPDAYARLVYERTERGEFRAGRVDMQGKPVGGDLREAPGGYSLLGRHPFWAWHARKTYGFVAEPDYGLYDEQVAVAVMAVIAGIAAQFGSFGAWVVSGELRGTEDETLDAIERATQRHEGRSSAPKRTVRIGLQGMLQTEENGKVQYIQPRSDPGAMLTALVQVMQISAMMRNISPKRFDLSPEGSNVTGAAREVQEQPLLSAREQAETLLARNTVGAWEVWRAVRNSLYPPGDDRHIPPNYTVRPVFEHRPYPYWDQAAAQAAEILYRLGVRSPEQDVRLMEGVTEEEAIRVVAERRARQAGVEAELKAVRALADQAKATRLELYGQQQEQEAQSDGQ